MTPSTTRIPPPKRAGPHEFTSPPPKPPTLIGAAVKPPPPPRPAPPPPSALPPSGPHPVVMLGFTHLRLRSLTVLALTSSRKLKRLPLRSPEYVLHSSESGFKMSAGLRPPVSGDGLGGPICIVWPVQPGWPGRVDWLWPPL